MALQERVLEPQPLALGLGREAVQTRELAVIGEDGRALGLRGSVGLGHELGVVDSAGPLPAVSWAKAPPNRGPRTPSRW